MPVSIRNITVEDAVRLGEEAQRHNLSWMDAVQKLRREYPTPLSKPLLDAFALGWTAAEMADNGVRVCAEGAE